MSVPSSSSGWRGQWRRRAPHGEGQWWQEWWQADAGGWQVGGASNTWEGGSGSQQSRKKRKVHEGGWSQQEGVWRHIQEPDGFVIKTLYLSPKSLGDGLWGSLKEEAMENYAITKVTVRGRQSIAGRKATREQGCSHQLTIIGRDCMLAFKLVFRKAVWDRGLEMPDHVPHMRIVEKLADDTDTRPSLPAHPDDAAKRCAPPPPPPSGEGEGSSGGGSQQAKAEEELGGGEGSSGRGSQQVEELGGGEGSSGGGLPPLRRSHSCRSHMSHTQVTHESQVTPKSHISHT